MEDTSIRMWFDTGEGEEEFELIGTFVLEEQEYAALHPVDGAQGEVILLAMEEDNDEEPVFWTIEDEEEYETAGEVFEALFNGEAEAVLLPDEDEE